MLTPELKEECLKIVEELLNHPISDVFSRPVDPVLDDMPDYFERIAKPNDLTTVKERLLSDTYHTLAEFKQDISLVWENAFAYNRKQTLAWFIAEEIARIFNRRFSKLETSPVEQWAAEYLKARSTICKLFRSTPKCLGSISTARETPLTQDERSVFRRRPSREEEEIIQAATPYLTDRSNSKVLNKIILEADPQFPFSFDNLVKDIPLLSGKAYRSLRQWMIESIVNPTKEKGGSHQVLMNADTAKKH